MMIYPCKMSEILPCILLPQKSHVCSLSLSGLSMCIGPHFTIMHLKETMNNAISSPHLLRHSSPYQQAVRHVQKHGRQKGDEPNGKVPFGDFPQSREIEKLEEHRPQRHHDDGGQDAARKMLEKRTDRHEDD